MDRGYIKLWRKIDESGLYNSEPFDKMHAWIDLLMLANHKARVVNIRGIMLDVDRGQVLAGEDFLSTRWRWSRGKVRRYLGFLEKTVQQIVQQKNNVCSIISIVNYGKYQDNGTADGTANGTTDGQQTVQQTDIPNNVKNVKNEKKLGEISKKFKKPLPNGLDRTPTDAEREANRIAASEMLKQLEGKL